MTAPPPACRPVSLARYITQRLGTPRWTIRPDTPAVAQIGTRYLSVAEYDALCRDYLAEGHRSPGLRLALATDAPSRRDAAIARLTDVMAGRPVPRLATRQATS